MILLLVFVVWQVCQVKSETHYARHCTSTLVKDRFEDKIEQMEEERQDYYDGSTEQDFQTTFLK